LRTDWYFLRHGETDYNRKTLMQGHIDIPLNDNGRRQAREARDELKKQRLSFQHIYSSTLDRAAETGEIVTGRTRRDFSLDPRIIEMGFGVWEGISYVEGGPEILRLNDDPEHYIPPKGGESFEDVYQRAHDFIEDLKRAAAPGGDDAGGNVLIATHGCTLRSILRVLSGLPLRDFWTVKVGNCDMFHYAVEDGVIRECPMVLRHQDPFDPHFMEYQKNA
jgi:alpha-ribazole phosphatase